MLVEKRETRYRVQWYYRLFEETQRGLTRYPNNVEVVHGSLLALGELLRHTGALSRPHLCSKHMYAMGTCKSDHKSGLSGL